MLTRGRVNGRPYPILLARIRHTNPARIQSAFLAAGISCHRYGADARGCD
jgi:hypothetical protein